MVGFVKRMLPLLAAFLLGSALVVFASAEPEKCDWSQSGDVSVTFIGPGASTPEEALRYLDGHAANITIPQASLTQKVGGDRFVETALDKETGSVSYAVYIDGVHRIQTTVEQLSDGTYYPTGFSICYGV